MCSRISDFDDKSRHYRYNSDKRAFNYKKLDVQHTVSPRYCHLTGLLKRNCERSLKRLEPYCSNVIMIPQKDTKTDLTACQDKTPMHLCVIHGIYCDVLSHLLSEWLCWFDLRLLHGNCLSMYGVSVAYSVSIISCKQPRHQVLLLVPTEWDCSQYRNTRAKHPRSFVNLRLLCWFNPEEFR